MAIENMLAKFGENMNGDMAGISCNIFAWASHAGHEIAPWRNLWGDFLSGLIDLKHAMAAPPPRLWAEAADPEARRPDLRSASGWRRAGDEAKEDEDGVRKYSCG
ncbi:hypothetical protein ACEUBB_06655 [Aeromonas rivipollensis]|uniref:hypothetical protein n=1 Tax=Aeromonas rivipollensis TaxID=948519 RepID=UPI0038CF8B08